MDNYRCILVGDKVEKIHRVRIANMEFDLDELHISSGNYLDRELMYQWLQNTEKGQWCVEHCTNFETVKESDFPRYMYRVAVFAEMTDKDYTFYLLKWKDDKKTDIGFFINTK